MLVPVDSYLIVQAASHTPRGRTLRHLVPLDQEHTFCGLDADRLIYHGTHTGDVWAAYRRAHRACAVCEAYRLVLHDDELLSAGELHAVTFAISGRGL